VDLTHNWSVGGRTHHVEVLSDNFFILNFKEENVIIAKWISGDSNSIWFYALVDPQWEGVTGRD
jgi:hypothetical protein